MPRTPRVVAVSRGHRGAAIFLLLPGVVAAQDFTGKVVGVTDGDTLTVLHNGRGEKIRLHGVDCPEGGQPFGAKTEPSLDGLST